MTTFRPKTDEVILSAAAALLPSGIARRPSVLRTPRPFSSVRGREFFRDNPPQPVWPISPNERMNTISLAFLQSGGQDSWRFHQNPVLIPGQTVEKGRMIGRAIRLADRLQPACLPGDLNRTRTGFRVVLTGFKVAGSAEFPKAAGPVRRQPIPGNNDRTDPHRGDVREGVSACRPA